MLNFVCSFHFVKKYRLNVVTVKSVWMMDGVLAGSGGWISAPGLDSPVEPQIWVWVWVWVLASTYRLLTTLFYVRRWLQFYLGVGMFHMLREFFLIKRPVRPRELKNFEGQKRQELAPLMEFQKSKRKKKKGTRVINQKKATEDWNVEMQRQKMNRKMLMKNGKRRELQWRQ